MLPYNVAVAGSQCELVTCFTFAPEISKHENTTVSNHHNTFDVTNIIVKQKPTTVPEKMSGR
ncbi:hypothetical protein Hanom_Chr07g00676751 [Helianthus anomalus]